MSLIALYILTRSPAFVKLYSVVLATVGTTIVVLSVDQACESSTIRLASFTKSPTILEYVVLATADTSSSRSRRSTSFTIVRYCVLI